MVAVVTAAVGFLVAGIWEASADEEVVAAAVSEASVEEVAVSAAVVAAGRGKRFGDLVWSPWD